MADLTHLQGRVAVDVPDVGALDAQAGVAAVAPVATPVVQQAITVTAAEREDTSDGIG